MKVERIQEIYALLPKYEIALAPDPRARGPAYLQELIARCRNYQNAVSRMLLETNQEEQTLSADLRSLEAIYQMKFDTLLANDETIKALPSLGDRKATASVFLREEQEAITKLKASLEDLSFVTTAIKHRHKELVSTMAEIRLQRSLIQAEIDLGSMYGDEYRKQQQDGSVTSAEDVGLSPAELDSLFSEVREQSDDTTEDTTTQKSDSDIDSDIQSPSPTTNAVISTSEAPPIDDITPKPATNDLEDFLNGI